LEFKLKSNHENQVKLYYRDWLCLVKSYLHFVFDWLEVVAKLKKKMQVQRIADFINKILLLQNVTRAE